MGGHTATSKGCFITGVLSAALVVPSSKYLEEFNSCSIHDMPSILKHVMGLSTLEYVMGLSTLEHVMGLYSWATEFSVNDRQTATYHCTNTSLQCSNISLHQHVIAVQVLFKIKQKHQTAFWQKIKHFRCNRATVLLKEFLNYTLEKCTMHVRSWCAFWYIPWKSRTW